MSKNTTNTNDFSVAKVGDRVWVRLLNDEGWGVITDINPAGCDIIFVEFLGMTSAYTSAGTMFVNSPQCLFWSKPEIIAPPRPKRMVKKVVEVRPWKDCHGIIRLASDSLLYEHEGSPLNCGPVQTIEILVEEE